MAIPDIDDDQHSDSDAHFAAHSHLSYLVPLETDINLDEAFQGADPSVSLLDSIPRRKSLFFDETVDVLLILRTPWAGEKALRSRLSRLLISLEAHIVNTAVGLDQDTLSPPAHDAIFSGTVQDMDDPFIVVDESEGSSDDSDVSDDDERGQHIYAIWKMPVFLARPRLRLRRPVVLFHASAGLRSADGVESPGEAGYLKSGVPSGFNLLEAFANDPALEGAKPRLSALRVSRVAPLTQSQESAQSIRALKELRLDIIPAIHARVRISRPSTQPPSATLIAMLEVDFGSSLTCDITVDTITPTLKGGNVDDLNNQPGLSLLPMTCTAHDHVTFLYCLAPSDLDDVAKNPTRDLDITIEATANLGPNCTPRLNLTWTTPLDFTIPVNPGFGPAMQPIQRSHRPSQLSISGAESSFIAPSVSRPDALPSLEAATSRKETAVPEFGITMTLCAAAGPVYVGEVFSWAIYVVNRTSDKSANPLPPARKLAILALPRRRRGENQRVQRPLSVNHPNNQTQRAAGPAAAVADGGRQQQVADAALDENIVHAMHKNSLVDAADVVCLSSDVRIGPLAPGTCHVAELKFLALRAGVLDVDAVRVVDLGSQEHVDVTDLPAVVVEKRQDGTPFLSKCLRYRSSSDNYYI